MTVGSVLLCMLERRPSLEFAEHRVNRLAAQMDKVGANGCRERRTRFVRDLEGCLRDPRQAVALIEEAILQAEESRECGDPLEIEAHQPDRNSARPSRLCAGCGKKRRHSIYNRAVKLAEATARHLADDNAPTPSAAREFRTACCNACPLRDGRECSECGCYLDQTVLNRGKIRWRSEACPLGKWHRHHDSYRPLVNPTRNLIFHIYPLIGAEWNWHWHIEKIRAASPLFNGKIAIGITTGDNLADAETVKDLFAGIPVADWVVRENSKQLGEMTTFIDLLSLVKTDDPNTITLRGHTKGVTHHRQSVEQPWAKLLWETSLDIPSVEDALASHIVAGSMLSHEPLVPRRPGDFFYAGSWYWFRSDVFQRDWSSFEPNRWWVEYWPGQVANSSEAACLCHDFVKGSTLNHDYWREHVAPEFERWQSARRPRSQDVAQKKIPVFINVRNRLTTTRKLAEQIAELDTTVPILIDNASDWGPLLDWYDTCQFEVIRLDGNHGHYAPWTHTDRIPRTPDEQAAFIEKYGGPYYVVTDCDLDIGSCPIDLLKTLAEPFSWGSGIIKSGLSLQIDDLPPWQTRVKKWESRFWKKPIESDGGKVAFYEASIDTTFAMYDVRNPRESALTPRSLAVRSAPPCMARHVPWYLDGENLDQENQHYFATANASNSWKPQGRGLVSPHAK